MPGTSPSDSMGGRSNENRELELSSEAMRSLTERTVERLIAHVESLPDQPASETAGAEALAASLREPTPESGQPFDGILATLFERVFPVSFNTASPGYLAYIPGGGLFQTALADFISAATNRYTTVFVAGPGQAQIEATVVRWFADWIGYPDTAGGFLASGGSLANFSAIVTARQERLPENFLDGTLYVSEQVHHSITKSARLAGFPTRNVRAIPTDDRFCIRCDLLHEAITADRASGRRPFLVVGSAGTTNTGAIDDLEALAQIAAREDLWFHVDGAYGGFFVLTERGRTRMRGLASADSITLDPHKALFLPYGTGSLIVKDRRALQRAHSERADYMPAMQEDADHIDLCEISPELSRGFRGLRVWLPLKLHGVGPFRDNLEEKLDLATWVTEAIRDLPNIEIVAEPQLSIVAFRHRPQGLADGPELDAHNRRLMERVNSKRRVFLTGTSLGGRFVIRICVLSFRTHRDRMQEAFESIRDAVAAGS